MSALIAVRISALIFIAWMVSPVTLPFQDTKPDKFINYIKKDPSSIALTIPGWFIKMVGNLAARTDMDDSEAVIIKELTGHIKKLRFVVAEKLPEGIEDKFAKLKDHLAKESYEPLVNVRDQKTKVQLWAKFDDKIIKRMVISVLNDDDSSVFFNIKSELDFDKLKKMDFYKEMKNGSIVSIPSAPSPAQLVP